MTGTLKSVMILFSTQGNNYFALGSQGLVHCRLWGYGTTLLSKKKKMLNSSGLTVRLHTREVHVNHFALLIPVMIIVRASINEMPTPNVLFCDC